jgi:hypothetical protein
VPTWGEILVELTETAVPAQGVPPQFDAVRRKYLAALGKYTRRETILYATKWTQGDDLPPAAITITPEDIQGFMAVMSGLKGNKLDLILHSPGGSGEAAKALVDYLRSKFDDIRVIIPQMAMSAATMLACCADVIVMGKHSFLGPIDPQLVIQTPLGARMAPAQGIIDQFELAKKECANQENLAAWIPMLSQYGPDLLVYCDHAIKLSRDLVEDWLKRNMFKNDRRSSAKAKAIAAWLSNHQNFHSHGRYISRDEAEEEGLVLEELEADQTLQDLVLSVFHATTHTFSGTNLAKIIENQNGIAFMKQVQIVQPIQMPYPIAPRLGPKATPPSAPQSVPQQLPERTNKQAQAARRKKKP